MFLAGATLNFTSCSKDEVETPVNNTPAVTTPTNGALIDGTEAQKSSEPAMNDKTAVLETTAGKFEVGFASKPTESGTYTVKSTISAKNASMAARAAAGTLKEVTVTYTSKDNIVYKAADNAGGTVTITIKDGKMTIDISNLNVCNSTTCKKVSVKYDFYYTPPVVNPDPVDPDPVDPGPINPNPSTGDPGTAYINGVKSVSTFGTGMSLGRNVVFNTPVGSFQVWFKDKPMVGTFKVRSYQQVLMNNKAADEAGFVFVDPTKPATGAGGQFWSSDTSGGTIIVTASGNDLIIEAKDITVCSVDNYGSYTNECKKFSAFYKIPKPQ
ncbi:MAG: hypothetical protein H6584_06755 [Flavobacteriales bacterium]|nr:hypothetical protein [Flavobacteriales bacterium]